MTLVRPARPDDAAGILAILNPLISETTITFSAEQLSVSNLHEALSENQRQSAPYLVADSSGAIDGYAKYGPFRAGDGYARTAEITVHVAPAARGRKLGRRLVNALNDHASNAGIHSLIAGISAENVPAMEFHRKLGFEQVGLVPQAGYKFGRFIDLVLMQKFV
ncbi:phosphinothricin acetyltransferase [Litoreibacter meonggei]|uniref:Phosphinothricin acetyltransferase n=1 Tax=Litoreibacter meonggei TaxID=1049199 RepID=A0A497X401_9RHOB|nr:GNAT family N-acetyltransferase [Litoreibacter meonggei]RLJ59094.1 phosphinothricin acetyltransferase [Litoreibacter meonggei]